MRSFTASSPHHAEQLVVFKRHGAVGALDLGGYETRNPSVLRLVADADALEPLPDWAPVIVNTSDRPLAQGDDSFWALSFSTADGFLDVPVPDFLFDGWPQVGLGDYEDARERARAAGATAAQRHVVGWIGNCRTHERRWELHRIAQQNPELFDVRDVEWVPRPGEVALGSAQANHLGLEDQVRLWGALIDVEGNGWSARLKLLLHSGRPVLVQERPWREWFWDRLVPMEHFIPVRRDLSDVVEQARWVVEHPDEAARIGAAGQAFAQQHLTRAAAVREWASVLRRVASAPRRVGPPPGREALEAALRAVGA